MPKGVVGGDEEPAVAAGAHYGRASRFGEHVGIVCPMHGVGAALGASEIGGGSPGVQVDLVLLPGDLVNRKCHRRGGQVDDGVDALIEPLARYVGADIRLVLVVSLQDFDIEAAAAEILH